MPNNRTDPRMTPFICVTVSDGTSRRFNPFQPSIDPADRIDELKLDVTAPTIAASPSTPIDAGTARANNSGIVSAGLTRSLPATSAGHGYANAAMPISSGGITNAIVITP